MSGRSSNFGTLYCRVVFTVCVAACGIAGAAGGPARAGQPIEISTPKAQTLVTNLNQLGTDIQAEPAAREFSMPQLFSPEGNSLQGVMPSPTSLRSAPVPSRRMREWLDQRKNWAFQTPEEVIRDIAMRDFLNLPGFESDNQDATQPASSVERYYERMWRARNGTGVAQTDDPFGLRKTDEEKKNSSLQPDSKMFSNVFDRAQPSLKELMAPDLKDQLSDMDAGAGKLLEAFGLSTDNDRNDELSPQKVAERNREKQQISQYQELLNTISSAELPVPGKYNPSANPWSSSETALTPALNSLNPFATVPGGIPNPALAPPTVPAMPVPSSLAPVPYATAPERTPAPQPNFGFSQRAF